MSSSSLEVFKQLCVRMRWGILEQDAWESSCSPVHRSRAERGRALSSLCLRRVLRAPHPLGPVGHPRNGGNIRDSVGDPKQLSEPLPSLPGVSLPMSTGLGPPAAVLLTRVPYSHEARPHRLLAESKKLRGEGSGLQGQRTCLVLLRDTWGQTRPRGTVPSPLAVGYWGPTLSSPSTLCAWPGLSWTSGAPGSVPWAHSTTA